MLTCSPHKQFYAPLLVLLFIASCNGQDKPVLPKDSLVGSGTAPAGKPVGTAPWSGFLSFSTGGEQISQYIRRMFQDAAGNLWFGTEADGVCRYDGRSLVYFTPAEGLSGNAVRGMAQDERGDLWFATRGGVSRYDGTTFTRFTTADGLADDQVWSLLLDRTGGFWFGTEGGVSRFNGKTFTGFPIPAADLTHFPLAYPSPKLISSIVQDKAGHIWFGSNGGGVYRYDGSTLTNLSEKDGLCNNFVTSILEDRAGNLWFGTRFGGLCRYDGKTFTSLTRKNDLTSSFVWTLYQDRAGTLWMGAVGGGACRTDGTTSTCYGEQDGLGNLYVQSILKDARGQLWFGTSGGVYRFNGTTFTNFTKKDAPSACLSAAGSRRWQSLPTLRTLRSQFEPIEMSGAVPGFESNKYIDHLIRVGVGAPSGDGIGHPLPSRARWL
ncbi:MAG TPA: two-component regulator propeller domain-containing protein [Thermoanaerobaculia bacterium]|jgi:ligand-binding sensor domain-containing protein|nr:two-component regulator propeller domain-containing protein [Thermoanaerobaculia bacterium]